MNAWEMFLLLVVGMYSVLGVHWCWMLSRRIMRIEKILFKHLYPEENIQASPPPKKEGDQ